MFSDFDPELAVPRSIIELVKAYKAREIIIESSENGALDDLGYSELALSDALMAFLTALNRSL